MNDRKAAEMLHINRTGVLLEHLSYAGVYPCIWMIDSREQPHNGRPHPPPLTDS